MLFERGQEVQMLDIHYPGHVESINLSQQTWDRDIRGKTGVVVAIDPKIGAPGKWPEGGVAVEFRQGKDRAVMWWVQPCYIATRLHVEFVEEREEG